MLDLGCWILDVGSWMLDLGCWILDVGSWMLVGILAVPPPPGGSHGGINGLGKTYRANLLGEGVGGGVRPAGLVPDQAFG